MRLLLDTNVLGEVCHPSKGAEAKMWLNGILGVRGHAVFVPDVVDYELRRKLIQLRSGGLARLDALPSRVPFVATERATWLLAAELWAGLRARGLPTESDEALGVDVIVAAHAVALGAVVVTDNTKHIGRMAEAKHWRDL
ncbi:MAG: type II toxin-antitoxin system VapC family toxin [Polyangiales bacterium]